MTSDRLGWIAAFLLLVAFTVTRGVADHREGQLADRQARIDSLSVVADSLKDRATKADTVLVHVTDTLRVTVERTRVVQAAASDSLYAMADSAEAVQLDVLLSAHVEEVEALERQNAATLAWGNTWKDYAGSLENVNAELRIANTLAYGLLRSQKRKSKLNQAVAVVGAAYVCADAGRRGRVGIALASCGIGGLVAIAGG